MRGNPRAVRVLFGVYDNADGNSKSSEASMELTLPPSNKRWCCCARFLPPNKREPPLTTLLLSASESPTSEAVPLPPLRPKYRPIETAIPTDLRVFFLSLSFVGVDGTSACASMSDTKHAEEASNGLPGDFGVGDREISGLGANKLAAEASMLLSNGLLLAPKRSRADPVMALLGDEVKDALKEALKDPPLGKGPALKAGLTSRRLTCNASVSLIANASLLRPPPGFRIRSVSLKEKESLLSRPYFLCFFSVPGATLFLIRLGLCAASASDSEYPALSSTARRDRCLGRGLGRIGCVC